MTAIRVTKKIREGPLKVLARQLEDGPQYVSVWDGEESHTLLVSRVTDKLVISRLADDVVRTTTVRLGESSPWKLAFLFDRSQNPVRALWAIGTWVRRFSRCAACRAGVCLPAMYAVPPSGWRRLSCQVLNLVVSAIDVVVYAV